MITKKLRSYFEEKLGDWAAYLTDEQIEDMVISFFNGMRGKKPESQPSIENPLVNDK